MVGLKSYGSGRTFFSQRQRKALRTRQRFAPLRLCAEKGFSHGTERSEDDVEEWRGYAKTKLRRLIVMQQVILSKIPEEAQPRSPVMRLEVKPFVTEITRR